MAHQLLRIIGKVGAHADREHAIARSDIPILTDLLEAILEYLYIAPAKVRRAEARLNRGLAKDPGVTDAENLPSDER